jgi:hypothetical protein
MLGNVAVKKAALIKGTISLEIADDIDLLIDCQ